MSAYKPCPSCGNTNAKAVGYTWWGGVIGPRLLTHVKCQNCGTTYNGKTGKSNTTAILVMLIAVMIIGFIIGFAIAL